MNNNVCTTLKVVIKREWFDQIAAKKKKIECRDVAPFWTCRLYDKYGMNRIYDSIEFINGYNSDARVLLTMFEGFQKKGELYHIHIGKILK